MRRVFDEPVLDQELDSFFRFSVEMERRKGEEIYYYQYYESLHVTIFYSLIVSNIL